jgi:hypothetical protein
MRYNKNQAFVVKIETIKIQKKVQKNPFFSRCLIIYDIYELWQLISKYLVHYWKSYPLDLYMYVKYKSCQLGLYVKYKSYPLGLYVKYILKSVEIWMEWVHYY